MSLYRWRTTTDGYVEVDKGDGFQVISLADDTDGITGQKAPNAITERVMGWADLARDKGAKYGVPPAWILGVIYAESAGEPTARNACCAGLMAINLSVHGKTEAQMFDPEQNVDYGTSLLSSSVECGLQLPEAASLHNGGGESKCVPHPSTKSPWGMRENAGYIERVVRASNFFRGELGEQPGPPGPSVWPPPARSLTQKLAGLLSGVFIGWSLANYWRGRKKRRV